MFTNFCFLFVLHFSEIPWRNVRSRKVLFLLSPYWFHSCTVPSTAAVFLASVIEEFLPCSPTDDHSRVMVEPAAGVAYINANYIEVIFFDFLLMVLFKLGFGAYDNLWHFKNSSIFWLADQKSLITNSKDWNFCWYYTVVNQWNRSS